MIIWQYDGKRIPILTFYNIQETKISNFHSSSVFISTSSLLIVEIKKVYEKNSVKLVKFNFSIIMEVHTYCGMTNRSKCSRL